MVSVSRRAPCCPSALWLEVLLLLLRGLGLCLNHLLLWVRDVVFPHVLHQVRLLQREEWHERTGLHLQKSKPMGGTQQIRGLLPLNVEQLLLGKCIHFCCPPRAANTHRGVGPAADGAGVDLGVFHCVGSQVYLQRGSIRVRPVAVVALERFVFVVLPSVRLGDSSSVKKRESKQGRVLVTAKALPLTPPSSHTLSSLQPPPAEGGTSGLFLQPATSSPQVSWASEKQSLLTLYDRHLLSLHTTLSQPFPFLFSSASLCVCSSHLHCSSGQAVLCNCSQAFTVLCHLHSLPLPG